MRFIAASVDTHPIDNKTSIAECDKTHLVTLYNSIDEGYVVI